MLIAAVLYALHLPINQRVLYDVPAPTVTVYTLLAMSMIVVPAYLLFDQSWPAITVPWFPVLALTAVTFLSRLMLFLGVKHIGGMQTALLGLGELLVAIVFSHLLLGESLTTLQWVGTGGLSISLLLVWFEITAVQAHAATWTVELAAAAGFPHGFLQAQINPPNMNSVGFVFIPRCNDFPYFSASYKYPVPRTLTMRSESDGKVSSL